MKIYKLFPFALAAMAFASCSNEDENGQNPNGEKGELVEAITVSFASSASTYAATKPGVGTENNIYQAFIFAKEAVPSDHNPALDGDYTVKMVGNGTDLIGDGGSETTPGMKYMATFNGVASGDSVFVIVNDPTMTMDIAKGLAHAGQASYTNIKNYQAKLEKSYLNGLTKKMGTAIDGKFVMAGRSVIPKAKNGTTVEVPVLLDRELAKVELKTSVTTEEGKEATGKVVITNTGEDADGLIVVRIPRIASPFKQLIPVDYFPKKAGAADCDWNVDADGHNVWNAFAGNTNDTPTTTVRVFNNFPKANDVKEYRYTWKIGSEPTTDLLTYDPTTKVMTSPTFYVTPSYTNYAGSNTAVVIQATYTGETTIFPEIAAVLEDLEIITDEAKKWDTTANLDALLVAINKVNETGTPAAAIKAKYGKVATSADLVDYKKDCKLFYRADIAEYTGSNSTLNTKRNTYYSVEAVITSLGAKTIEGATEASNVNIIVTVTVNDWSLILNKIAV